MKRVLLPIALASLLASTSGLAAEVRKVFAEGRGESPVAEHVVRKLSKDRAFASARALCHRYYQLTGEPVVIAASGYDTAWYQHGMWYGHFYADFQCRDINDPSNTRNYGPWQNLDQSRAYSQLSTRMSWWTAKQSCEDAGMRLPTWREIASDYRYLKGTTPMLDNYRMDVDSGFPQFWTGDEKNAEMAFEFSERQLSSGQDHRGMYKETRYAVLCVQ